MGFELLSPDLCTVPRQIDHFLSIVIKLHSSDDDHGSNNEHNGYSNEDYVDNTNQFNKENIS